MAEDNLVALAQGGARTLAGVIVNDLRRRILAGELADGVFLRQDLLAKEYNISRLPVREALGQLAAEGLIVHIPHRGMMIPVLSAAEVLDLYETRAVLEPHLIRNAIPKMDLATLRELKAALTAMDNALNSQEMANWGQLNADFHNLLYKPSGRALAIGIVQSLLHKSDRYATLNIAISGDKSKAQDEHTEIYNLCAQGAADEAAIVLRNHLQQSGKSLIAALELRQAK